MAPATTLVDQAGLSSQSFSFQTAELIEVLEDLSTRFILNLPPSEMSSVPRLVFQVEQAYWYYEDWVREVNPALPSYNLKRFCDIFFKVCPVLSQWDGEHERMFLEFMRYKSRVPVCGAIMINETWDKCVLVKGWKGNSWSFPKGKINQDEPKHICAIREVLEETGCDLTRLLDKDNFLEVTMQDQRITLYIVPGVPEDFPFKTQTRKEIGAIEWFKLSELPMWKKNRGHPPKAISGRYYMMAPFIPPLKKFVKQHRPTTLARSSSFSQTPTPSSEAAPSTPPLPDFAEPAPRSPTLELDSLGPQQREDPVPLSELDELFSRFLASEGRGAATPLPVGQTDQDVVSQAPPTTSILDEIFEGLTVSAQNAASTTQTRQVMPQTVPVHRNASLLALLDPSAPSPVPAPAVATPVHRSPDHTVTPTLSRDTALAATTPVAAFASTSGPGPVSPAPSSVRLDKQHALLEMMDQSLRSTGPPDARGSVYPVGQPSAPRPSWHSSQSSRFPNQPPYPGAFLGSPTCAPHLLQPPFGVPPSFNQGSSGGPSFPSFNGGPPPQGQGFPLHPPSFLGPHGGPPPMHLVLQSNFGVPANGYHSGPPPPPGGPEGVAPARDPFIVDPRGPAFAGSGLNSSFGSSFGPSPLPAGPNVLPNSPQTASAHQLQLLGILQPGPPPPLTGFSSSNFPGGPSSQFASPASHLQQARGGLDGGLRCGSGLAPPLLGVEFGSLPQAIAQPQPVSKSQSVEGASALLKILNRGLVAEVAAPGYPSGSPAPSRSERTAVSQ